LKERSIFHGFLKLINSYSIDVVTGGVMMGLFAARILDLHPSVWWYVILALAVWVFYTADHLLDALRGKEQSTIERHLLHYVYRQRIIPLWIAAGFIAAWLAFLKLDIEIIFSGLLLAFLILTYFVILYYNKKRFPWLLQKELIIGLVYVAGIWMGPLYWYGNIPPAAILALAGNMFLLAWGEGIIVSRFEYEEDLKNGHTSFTTMFGKKVAGQFVTGLLIVVIGTDIYFLASGSLMPVIRASLIIQAGMSLVLFMLQLFPAYFARYQLYRYIGEVTFWLPGLILLVK
jgi:hypothetical protein